MPLFTRYARMPAVPYAGTGVSYTRAHTWAQNLRIMEHTCHPLAKTPLLTPHTPRRVRFAASHTLSLRNVFLVLFNTAQVAAMMAHPEIDFDALEERRAAAGGSGGSGGGMGGGEEQEEDGGEGSEFEELERMDRTEFEGAGDERSAAQQARRLRGSRAEGGADGEEWEEGLEEEGELYDEGEGEAEEEEDQDEEGGARGAAVALQRHRTVLYVTAEETREQVRGGGGGGCFFARSTED